MAAFLIAIVVLALFVAWELHTPEPMLDMHYFKRPAFSTGTGGMILVFVAMYGVMFLITQYFQLVLGYSALSAALRLMPIAAIMMVVAPMTPRLERAVRRTPHRRVRHALHRSGLRSCSSASPPTRRTRTWCCASSRSPPASRCRCRR